MRIGLHGIYHKTFDGQQPRCNTCDRRPVLQICNVSPHEHGLQGRRGRGLVFVERHQTVGYLADHHLKLRRASPGILDDDVYTAKD